jgi:hypothetical protein
MRISDCGFNERKILSLQSAFRNPKSEIVGLFFPAAINYNPTRKENEGAPEILCFG